MGKKISIRKRQIQYQEKYQRKFTLKWFWFCREPLENIRGWSEMLNDTSDTIWHMHHRDEISEDGEVASVDELKSRGEYYNLPASKLIFMTESAHSALHNSTRTGEKNPMHGKHHSEENKQKLRELNSGKNNPMYGKHHSEESKKMIRENSWMRGRTGELNPNYKYDITEEELYELYVVKRLTQQEIADKFRCCQSHISKKLKKFGIRKQDV